VYSLCSLCVLCALCGEFCREACQGRIALVSLNFQLGVVAPEWARPTLFFGEAAGLARGEAKSIVREVAERVVVGRGFELVDVEIKRAPGGTMVRLTVDREGGIGLDDLQSVSEEVSAILDAEDPITSSYTLECTSPGLDRPLRGEADYRRFLGRLARLSSYEPVDGRRQWTGRLLAVEDGRVRVTLEAEGGKVAEIPVDKIAHGRLEVEFPR
jgi:ribosome maturation factor RimP